MSTAVRTFVPPSFSAFGKTGLFQTYDKDELEHQVKLVHKSASKENVVFEPTIVFGAKQPRGVLKLAFTPRCPRVLSGVAVDATIQTEASKASTVTLKAKNVVPKVLPGLNVTVTESTSERDFSAKPRYGAFGTVAADYSRNNASVTASVTSDADANHSVSASAAVGFEGFSVGADVKLIKAAGAGAFTPKSYNAGVTYKRGVYTAAVVSDAKFEKIKATVFTTKLGNFVNPLSAGLQAKVDVQAPKAGKPQREVVLGLQQDASKNTTYKGAIVLTSGAAVFGVEHKFANAQFAATAVLSKPASFYAAWPVSKYGVSLSVGDV